MMNDIKNSTPKRQQATEWTPPLYKHWSESLHYPCPLLKGSAILPRMSAVQQLFDNISLLIFAVANDEIITTTHRSDILENLSQH